MLGTVTQGKAVYILSPIPASMGKTVIEGTMMAIGSPGGGDIESIQVKVMDGYPIAFNVNYI